MTQLYAQPYDITATGFYFETAEEYAAKAAKNKNDYGEPVEEYEFQFIDGELIDAQFANPSLNQKRSPKCSGEGRCLLRG